MSTPIFLRYFYKHFPQLNGKLSSPQLQTLYEFAGHITQQNSGEGIWHVLENRQDLLQAFVLIVDGLLPSIRRSKKPEIFLLMSAFGLLTCLVLIILLKNNLPLMVLNMISFTIGVFGTCLKESFSRYFSLILEEKK